MKTSFAQIVARQEQIRKTKIEDKIPGWSSAKGLEFPSDLSLEQCSSEKAAEYKASTASSLFNDPSEKILWDLTGGLGVDSWAFSRCFGKVVYNERNELLFEAVKNNFNALGIDNVDFFCSDAEEMALPHNPDIIFLDPARRDDMGKKVFLVEDCRPDVLALLPALFEKVQYVVVKLSPMADISMLAGRFGGHLRQIHIVALEGECKELLCILSKSVAEAYDIIVKELSDGAELVYKSTGKSVAAYGDAAPGDWLWEPRAPLMKAGCFSLICERYAVAALHPSTHLYAAAVPAPSSLFKSFLVIDSFDFGKAGFKAAGEKYPCAEVTARNIPMTSQELKKRLGVKSGADYHIFGCLTQSGRKLLVTKVSHHSDRAQSAQ